jgi:hypothetical protein
MSVVMTRGRRRRAFSIASSAVAGYDAEALPCRRYPIEFSAFTADTSNRSSRCQRMMEVLF